MNAVDETAIRLRTDFGEHDDDVPVPLARSRAR